MLNLSLIYIYLILINKISYLDYTILIFCIVCFLVGLFDDIKNISSIKKLLIEEIFYVVKFSEKAIRQHFLREVFSFHCEISHRKNESNLNSGFPEGIEYL